MSARLTSTGRAMALALSAPALLVLGACSDTEPAAEDTVLDVSADQTVSDLLDDDPALSRIEELVDRTGLEDVLDAAPSYTLLAPTDTAMGALDPEQGASAADNPAMAALLRGHLLPGFVTLDDITKAIDASDDGRVTMQTMAQTPLTFTRSGDTVTVTAADGASATIGGPGKQGGNGVVMPIDGLLKTL